jgi:hypothetical protein
MNCLPISPINTKDGIAHSGEFVHRFRSCRPVTEGSNAGERIINQVDGMESWNGAFMGFSFRKKKEWIEAGKKIPV